MPHVRPFRALRYATEQVPDLAAVVAPPYDVIGTEERAELLARDPRNVVRLDLPIAEPRDEPDDRYRRAARLLSSWRTDGTLHRDPRPALYPYEQTYRVPGTDAERRRRGLFARVRLEAFGPDAGIRPHERTLSEPREDRYRLLRATGVNTSPVVGLYEEARGTVAAWLSGFDANPVAELTDSDGVGHRLWAASDDPAALEAICAAIGESVITLADGHHRYETALRYRDERLTGSAPVEDPAWADILMLLLEPGAGPLTVLATHRAVVGAADLEARADELFDVEARVGPTELVERFRSAALGSGGEGRFGLWTREGGLVLRARRPEFEPLLPAAGAALRGLDVSLAEAALEHLAGIDAAATADGSRIRYTKDPAEAVAWVEGGTDSFDAALLLEPTSAAAIVAVAAAGDVMPQKSTYIYPKALTGLVINPLE